MNTYFFLKSIHLIAVISWMAGLLYLPRIFVYHSQNLGNKEPGKRKYLGCKTCDDWCTSCNPDWAVKE